MSGAASGITTAAPSTKAIRRLGRGRSSGKDARATAASCPTDSSSYASPRIPRRRARSLCWSGARHEAGRVRFVGCLTTCACPAQAPCGRSRGWASRPRWTRSGSTCRICEGSRRPLEKAEFLLQAAVEVEHALLVQYLYAGNPRSRRRRPSAIRSKVKRCAAGRTRWPASHARRWGTSSPCRTCCYC